MSAKSEGDCMVFELNPVHEGSDELHTIRLQPDIPVVLGRNQTTLCSPQLPSKNALFLSKELVSLVLQEGVVKLKVLKQMLLVNEVAITPQSSPVSLNNGDVICLLPQAKYYSYKLCHVMSGPREPPNKKHRFINLVSPESPNTSFSGVDVLAASTQIMDRSPTVNKTDRSPTVNIIEKQNTNLLRMTDCSVCLLPMAYAHAIVPCGHTFCFTCIDDWMKQTKSENKCPLCQKDITSLISSSFTTGIISELLRSDAGAMEEWSERERVGCDRKRKLASSFTNKVVRMKPATVFAIPPPLPPYFPPPASPVSRLNQQHQQHLQILQQQQQQQQQQPGRSNQPRLTRNLIAANTTAATTATAMGIVRATGNRSDNNNSRNLTPLSNNSTVVDLT